MPRHCPASSGHEPCLLWYPPIISCNVFFSLFEGLTQWIVDFVGASVWQVCDWNSAARPRDCVRHFSRKHGSSDFPTDAGNENKYNGRLETSRRGSLTSRSWEGKMRYLVSNLYIARVSYMWTYCPSWHQTTWRSSKLGYSGFSHSSLGPFGTDRDSARSSSDTLLRLLVPVAHLFVF